MHLEAQLDAERAHFAVLGKHIRNQLLELGLACYSDQAGVEFRAQAFVLRGGGSCIFVTLDLRRRAPQSMAAMRFVWPITVPWAGVIGVWAYWAISRSGPRTASTKLFST